MNAVMSDKGTGAGIATSLPPDAVAELVFDADLDDERLRASRGENVLSLPLWFNVVQGMWVNITRATGSGVWLR